MDDLDKILEISPEREKVRIIKFIKESVAKLKKNGVILGLSGGLDSSIAASLAKEASPENCLALILPEKDSDRKNIKDAQDLAQDLDLEYLEIDITLILEELGTYQLLPEYLKSPLLVKTLLKTIRIYSKKKILHSIPFEEAFQQRKGVSSAFAFGMPKLRTRMILLHKHALINNYAVLGTTNKTEYLLGHYDVHGDGAVDMECLLHLYKTQEGPLARYLGVTQNIISKSPSPDLLPGLTDEGLIGMSFNEIDRILAFIEAQKDIREAKEYEILEEEIAEAKMAIANSEERRNLPLSLIR
jgi:NAD+ synthase